MDTSGMRKPFLPLSITKSDLAIPRELMIDYLEGILYVKSIDGKRVLELGKASSVEAVSNLINQLLGQVNENANSLDDLESRILPIKQWKEKMVNDDVDTTVNTLVDLINLFNNYGDSSETIKVKLDSKVNVDGDKGLSQNNFTTPERDKLIAIDTGANNYKHPNIKACAYEAPVKSINNTVKQSIVLTKEMLGMGNLDPNATVYDHPDELQCTPTFVTSVNGKVGSVNILRSDIGVDELVNIRPWASFKKTHPIYNDWFGYQIINKAPIDDVIEEAADIINKPISCGITSSFLSFTELLTLTGMTTTGVKVSTLLENLHWKTYRVRGKLVRACASNIIHGVSYATLESKGLLGDRVFSIRGKNYRIGLLPSWNYFEYLPTPDINSGLSSYVQQVAPSPTSTITCYGGKGIQSKCTTTKSSATAYESGYKPAWRPVIYEL